jgi:hypothetical protein
MRHPARSPAACVARVFREPPIIPTLKGRSSVELRLRRSRSGKIDDCFARRGFVLAKAERPIRRNTGPVIKRTIALDSSRN